MRSVGKRRRAVGGGEVARVAAMETLEWRRLLSSAFAVTGLTQLRNDPTYAGIDGSGITVAVLDTGVFGNHPDLVGNFRGYVDTVLAPAQTATFVTNPAASRDRDGHGTHVAGTVASTNPAIGVANAAKFIGVRVLLDAGERLPRHDPLLEGLQWVLNNHQQHNIRVVNMSLGIRNNLTSPVNNEVSRLMATLERVGITLVTANGNSYADFRAAGVSFPAVNSTLAVVSTWEDAGIGDPLPYSTGGGDNAVAIDFQPSADLISAYSQRANLPNQIAAPGTTIYSTWNGAGGRMYNTIPGTSMASPFIAGVVALMQDAAQTFGGTYLTPATVASILRETGDTIVDSPTSVNAYGNDAGQLFDLPETGLSFPRVNVYRAIERVRSLFVGTTPPGGGQPATGNDVDRTLQTAVVVAPMEPGDRRVFGDRSIGFDGTQSVGNADVDLYKVELLAPGILDVRLNAVAGQPAGRFALRFFDESGDELGEVTDASGYPAGQTALLPAGVYYVGVSGEANVNYDVVNGTGAVAATTGAYELVLESDSPDPDGGLLAANEVELLAIDDVDDDGIGFVTIEGVIGTDETDAGVQTVGTADVDVYAFIAPDSGFVDIDLEAFESGLDAFLKVFDENGNLLGFDDESGDEDGDAYLRVAVERGRLYFVAASSFEGRNFDPLTPTGGSAGPGASFGAYRLYLQFVNGDADGTALTATQIGLGTRQGNVGNDAGVLVGLDGTKDVDFYLVPASAGRVRFEVTAGFEVYLAVFIYDAQEDDLLLVGEAVGTSPTVELQSSAGELFWVAVTGSGNRDFDWFAAGSGSGGGTGAYTLRGQMVSPSAQGRRDDSIAGARSLTPGQTVTGVLGRDGNVAVRDVVNDVDVFRYVATGNGTATVRVRGTGDLPPDVFLRVFDAAGNEVGFNDDASEATTDAELTFAVTAGQTYYIGVSGFGENPRAYNIATGTGATGGFETGSYVVRLSENVTPPPPPPPSGPDLTAAITSVPAEVRPLVKRNPVGVTLTNLGDRPVRGSVRVNLYASADGVFDAGDLLLGSVSTRVSLGAGQSRGVTLNFASPASVAEGNYVVLAVVDADGRLAERDETNNLAVAGQTTLFVAPFVDLNVSVLSASASIRPNGRGFVTLRVTNTGNVPATGLLRAEALLGGAVGDVSLGVFGQLSRNLRLQPGRSLNLRVPLTRPADPGLVFVTGRLTWSGTPADTNAGNDQAFSEAPITLL